jgi:hypothetical protein
LRRRAGRTAARTLTDDLGAVGLLRTLGEAVGLLRTRGGRLQATALRPAWGRVDLGLRAGLVYAAWRQQVTSTGWSARGEVGDAC